MKKQKLILIIFTLFILISPWVWVLTLNFNHINNTKIKIISINDQLLIDEVNTLRGEMSEAGVPKTFARILVNRPTFYFLGISNSFLESFDPQYLFFTGDLNITKSTHSSGPLYLAFLPLMLVGVYFVWNEKRVLVFLLPLSLAAASFIENRYETLFRVPFLLLLTYFAAFGFVRINRKKVFMVFVIFLLTFEFLRFTHDFINHYPGRIEATVMQK